jgi:hypothetical protein
VTPYLLAVIVAAVGLLGLVLIVLRAVVLVRRFGVLASAYRRTVAAEAALLEHRRAGLLAEIARRRTSS